MQCCSDMWVCCFWKLATLTCDQVNEMGPSVTQVSASELQTLNTKDFNNCAQLLGRVDGFTKDQWTALAGVAKQVQYSFIHSEDLYNASSNPPQSFSWPNSGDIEQFLDAWIIISCQHLVTRPCHCPLLLWLLQGHEQLNYLIIDWLVDWLVGWFLIDWLIDWSVDRSIDWLFNCSFIKSLRQGIIDDIKLRKHKSISSFSSRKLFLFLFTHRIVCFSYILIIILWIIYISFKLDLIPPRGVLLIIFV